MDEILYHPGLALPKEDQKPQEDRLARLEKAANELLIRWDAFKGRLRPSAGRFLTVALILGAVFTASTVYTRGYAVKVDGQELGVVTDMAQFEAIRDRVENRVSEILGREYTLGGHVSYESRIVERKKVSSMAGFETYLFNQVDQVTRAYVLTVDGQDLSVQMDGQAVDDLLQELKAPYVNENTILAEFTVPVTLHCEYVGVNQVGSDMDALAAKLRSNTQEAVIYTVQKGDTSGAIAQDHDMSLSELMEMNPGVDKNKLMIGQELTVSQSVPYLGVRTVDRVSYQQAVEPPVEYVKDDSMYEGDSKVLEPGAEGLDQVAARITYVNGVEQQRDITDTQHLVEPTTKVVAQGTKERPKTMAKGNFIWPVRGIITSRYGGRSLFGSYNFHGGIDIAVPTGTSIKAADGGRVVTAEYHRSYGYYIVIDHENGKQTYYAHNSKLLVSVGQRVYQGQTIAKAGSTGTATGSHCHFEVRVGGQRQNPRNYLP